MARAFWKGVISFGMVAIPVRMSLATERKTPGFHLLHKKCLNRAKQVLYCPQEQEYFNIKDTVRGFEYAKDQYVVLDDKDLDKVPVKTSHSINILAFVEEKEIDRLYYSDAHYLEPDELGYTDLEPVPGAEEASARAPLTWEEVVEDDDFDELLRH